MAEYEKEIEDGNIKHPLITTVEASRHITNVFTIAVVRQANR